MLFRRSLAIMAAMAMIALNLPVLTYADSVGELDSTVLFLMILTMDIKII